MPQAKVIRAKLNELEGEKNKSKNGGMEIEASV
jgi:hypothetical protein